MQSATSFFNNNTTTTTTYPTTIVGGKVQFRNIKTVYPMGERITCYFAIPEVYQPEHGDFIGIVPVGWTSVARECVHRQLVPVEQFFRGVQHGMVVFDMPEIQQYIAGQQYQFVYVQRGEGMILGSSMPFRFVGEQMPEFYGQKYSTVVPTMLEGEWCPTGQEYQTIIGNGFPVVETEIQKMLNQIGGFEKQELFGEFYPVNKQYTVGINQQVWQPRFGKIEQIMREKIRIEQAQRRIEQLCVLAQLKSCERHIVSVQKHETKIREYLLSTKIQDKIAAFEQRCQQIYQQKGQLNFTTPIEQYVRKYEQLLKEKMQMDVEKRCVLLHKLRLTIRECERKLRNLQTIDQEHMTGVLSTLKNKWEQMIVRMPNTIGDMTPVEWCKHFETVMGPFLFEQEKTVYGLIQTQRELVNLTNEIYGKLQELETDVVSCYTTLRIPRITTTLMFNTHPKLNQIVQLERRLAEQKMKLKLRMLAQAGLINGSLFNYNGGRFVEQLCRGVWFTPVIEKLRMVQTHLYKMQQQMRQNVRLNWIEKKQQYVAQLINTLTQFQTELVGQSVIFDQTRIQNVLVQLRELRERECIEIPRFCKEIPTTVFGTVGPVVGELCQNLSEIIGEKVAELSQYVQWFHPQFTQFQMPSEWIYVTLAMHQAPSTIELFETERKLVEMKGLALAYVHYMHLGERLAELEQFVRYFNITEQSTIIKREQFFEKIRQLKTLINEHLEFPFYATTGSFFTVAEHFFQHQQQYEKLCQLAAEIECQLIELPIWSNVCDYETIKPFGLIGGRQTFGMQLICNRFLNLVQEFQLQFPECFAPKCEEIISYLRKQIISGRYTTIQQQPSTYFCQELIEKLVEFETILCQPECEVACMTTMIFPQSSTWTFKTQRECLKHLIRQVRELKSQVQFYHRECNNTVSWFPYESKVVGGASLNDKELVELWNNKMWTVEGLNTPRNIRYPLNGLVRSTTLEQIYGADEIQTPTLFKRSWSTRYPFELVNEDEINNNEWEELEFFGAEQPIEACLCQMEKQVRGGKLFREQSEWLINNDCLFCPKF